MMLRARPESITDRYADHEVADEFCEARQGRARIMPASCRRELRQGAGPDDV